MFSAEPREEIRLRTQTNCLLVKLKPDKNQAEIRTHIRYRRGVSEVMSSNPVQA